MRDQLLGASSNTSVLFLFVESGQRGKAGFSGLLSSSHKLATTPNATISRALLTIKIMATLPP
jgi:hypothetical protein